MGKKARRRRTKKHVRDNIEEPLIRARQLIDQGVLVETALVNISPESTEGFPVTCAGCGRTARSPIDPGQQVALCPRCQPRAGGEGCI